MSIVARLIIWCFFILIPTKCLEFFTLVHGSAVRPFQVYAVLILAAGVIVILHIKETGIGSVRQNLTIGEIALFAVLASLVLCNLASFGGHQDFLLKIAVWPAANLLMGIALFYFARFMGLGHTIIAAAAAALAVQFSGIMIDLWLPGTFAEWAPRPAGFPQNSNNGALLACFFMAMLLRARLRDRPTSTALYALIVGLPLIFATLSRSGLILYFAVLLIYAVALLAAPVETVASRARRGWLFAAVFLPCLLATAFLSPTLRLPDTISIWRDRIGFAAPDLTPNFASTAEAMITTNVRSFQEASLPRRHDTHENLTLQSELDESIRTSDDTVLQRINAAQFFWSEGIKHPVFGLGTGYSDVFKRGPHNEFLRLFAEDGLPAAALYSIALLLLSAIAIYRQSPALLAVVAIGWLDSILSHTVLVEPFLVVFAGAVLAASKPGGKLGEPMIACSNGL
jgi:hypothetical protein